MTTFLYKKEQIMSEKLSVDMCDTCAKALVDKLSELGIDTIFGYPGASVLSIYDELSQTPNIRHILVRHEQAAVHMAEGYAKVSDKPGCVLVTSGPGFTNTITGISNAYADSTPLIVLAGDVPLTNTKGKVFQKVDILSMTKSCCKKNYLVSSKDDIKQILQEAYEIANSGEKGPVIIALPRNILEAKYSIKTIKDLYKKKITPVKEYEYEKTANLLKNAKRPLLLLGGGASSAVDKIKAFVKQMQIPVVSTLMGTGVFPSNSDMYFGMIGVNGTKVANSILAEADFIIALGVSFSDRSTCKKTNFAQNAQIVSVNTKRILNGFELEINSDAKLFLQNFENYIKEYQPKHVEWIEHVQDIKQENTKMLKKSQFLSSAYVLEKIYEETKNLEPVVVTDVGQHQLLTAQFFNFNKPNKFITSGGLGTMGFGLPASIGASIANPDSLVLNITGDGSFQMNLQELATCREHNIPIKVIIMNNGYLGMVRELQEKIYNKCYQVKMTNPDFTKIAEAYDLCALRVTTAEELIPAIRNMLLHKGTVIVDIAIDAFEEV